MNLIPLRLRATPVRDPYRFPRGGTPQVRRMVRR